MPVQSTSIAKRCAGWGGVPPHLRGIALIILSGICFSAMSALTKHLGARLSFFEVAFFRSAVGWILVWPFVARAGLRALRTQHPGAHLARGIASGCSVLAIFYSVVHLPLADATAYGFTRNLFIVLLAAMFLHEPLQRGRSAVAVLGFAGVLIMLRPQLGLSPAALIALGGALMAAGVIIIIKRLMRSEQPVTVMFYFGLATTAITGLPAIAYWVPPTAHELLLLLMVGALGGAGQTVMIMAYRVCDATVLAPFDYLQLVFAALIGLLVFSERPTAFTAAGAALIVLANLYNGHRDATAAARAAIRKTPAASGR